MHYLHTLAFLIDLLMQGNPVAWTFFVLTALALGIAFVHDLRAHNSKDSSALTRLGPQ
jgi:hypothetical protein